MNDDPVRAGEITRNIAPAKLLRGENMRKHIAPILLTVTLALTASMAWAQAKDALYKSLGGKKAITAVVDLFVGNVAADTKINSFFAADVKDPKKLAKFKTNLVNQICEAAGGPCKYTGKSMKEAHAGMGISGADFDALVGDLVAALDKGGVKPADKMALLGVLGPMKSDIVEK
jgi:hemoglobin